MNAQESPAELMLPDELLPESSERGMATAEYAVGILAAVALALVLLKIITNESFFGSLLQVVVMIIGKISGMLP